MRVFAADWDLRHSCRKKVVRNGGYLLETEVCRLEGVACFILGLYDDIEILGGEELRAHVGYWVRMMKG